LAERKQIAEKLHQFAEEARYPVEKRVGMVMQIAAVAGMERRETSVTAEGIAANIAVPVAIAVVMAEGGAFYIIA